MSYDPGKTNSAMYTAYLSTSPSQLPSLGQSSSYEFLFDTTTGACKINSNGKIECEHEYSITTCDITTGTQFCIFTYGFTNGTYRTASHIRNEFSKGDDSAVGVHIEEKLIRVDTGPFYLMDGYRNINNLDQLAGVLI